MEIWRFTVSDIKRILGLTRKAIEAYDMIKDGDKIAVGVSGGKDSLTLLIALRRLKDFLPYKFDLEAVTISLGFDDFDLTIVKNICNDLDIPYSIEETQIGKIVFEERDEKSPCSLCANMRRGALNNVAVAHGCNKVALAHNYEDVIETALMNTLYEGNFRSFSPITYMENKDLYVIRPLIYAHEKQIKTFINKSCIVPVHNPCSANGKTKRQYIKNLINDLYKDNKHIKSSIFGAVQRSGRDSWHI